MTIDEKIDDWILEKFLWHGGYDKSKHGTIKSIKVVSVDMGWDCACWSDWTRDDTFELTAQFESDAGKFEWTYGRWGDLPTFIEELDEYINGNGCYYESEEYDEQYNS